MLVSHLLLGHKLRQLHILKQLIQHLELAREHVDWGCEKILLLGFPFKHTQGGPHFCFSTLAQCRKHTSSSLMLLTRAKSRAVV